jgi:hypothetical protein
MRICRILQHVIPAPAGIQESIEGFWTPVCTGVAWVDLCYDLPTIV